MSGRGYRLRWLAWLGLGLAWLAPARAAELPPLAIAEREARAILGLITAAVAAPDPDRPSLGPTLADYAQRTGTAPDRHEGFAAAARRILAGTSPTLLAPDAAARQLEAHAATLLAALQSLAALRADLRPEGYAIAAPALQATALLGRYHARRMLAAVRYNLFLRGQRLAELYAATLDTRATVEIWRELVTIAGDREALAFGSPATVLRGAWRAELTRLEFDCKDLEAMCCPPDESWLREKTWTPAAP